MNGNYNYRVTMALREAIALEFQGWPWLLARQNAASSWGVFTTDIQQLFWRLGIGRNRRRR